MTVASLPPSPLHDRMTGFNRPRPRPAFDHFEFQLKYQLEMEARWRERERLEKEWRRLEQERLERQRIRDLMHQLNMQDAEDKDLIALLLSAELTLASPCWKGALEDLVDALHDRLVVQPDPSQLGDAVVHPWFQRLLQGAKPGLKRIGVGIGTGAAVTVACNDIKIDVKLDPTTCYKRWTWLQNEREQRAHKIKKQDLAWKREDELAERAEAKDIQRRTF